MLLRAVPGSAEDLGMSLSGAGSARGGNTMLDQEFDASSLSLLRRLVLDCASAAGLRDDRALDVMLAMHELAANVIRHGTGRGRLLMQVVAGTLRCQVSDTDPALGNRVTGAPPSWPVAHGHGLWLVRRTADQVQVTNSPAGSVVSVGFTLPAALA
jgi:anti-sigma regulatory factor (Ser/Thr protein kinase)